MKIALNGATTMHATLEVDIRAARDAGFELIEIWKSKLFDFLAAGKTAGELKAALDEAGLAAWSINSIEHVTFRNVEDSAAIRDECERLCTIASEIGCPYIVVVPGKLPAEAVTKDDIIAESVRVLNELGDIAGRHGVGLAFEFLGQTDCSVQTLDLAKKIVEAVNRPEIGLVIDTFHFYAGNSTLEAIDSLDPDKLFIFHINDAEDLPRDQLTDAHRLYPGTGILPISEIKARFDKIGYDRMVSVEIFRPEYWEQDPFEVARRSKEATEQALGLGKYQAGGSW